MSQRHQVGLSTLSALCVGLTALYLVITQFPEDMEEHVGNSYSCTCVVANSPDMHVLKLLLMSYGFCLDLCIHFRTMARLVFLPLIFNSPNMNLSLLTDTPYAYLVFYTGVV